MEILKYTKSGVPVVGVDERGYNLYLHNCSICNEKFTSLGVNAKFCDKCKEKNLDKIDACNVCLSCGKPFIGKNGYQRYCNECENIENRNMSNKMSYVKDNTDKIKLFVEMKVTEIINKSTKKGNEFNNELVNYWNVGGFNEGIKDEVRNRDNYKCQVCGKDTNLHIHHIISRRNGGSHDLDNLILLCSSCHMAIETGDLEHAIKKCLKNALKFGGVSESVYKITDSYKVTIMQECLEDIFDRLTNDDTNKDILIDISSVLSKIE